MKEKKSSFLYLYGRGAQEVYTSESQDILFQLHVGFAGKFGKPFKGKNVLLKNLNVSGPQACLQTSLVLQLPLLKRRLEAFHRSKRISLT